MLERRRDPTDVDREHLIPLVEVEFVDATPGRHDPSGGDQKVELAAELPGSLSARVRDRVLVANVGGHRPPALGKRPGRGDIKANAARPDGREAAGDRGADPACGAGDERAASRKRDRGVAHALAVAADSAATWSTWSSFCQLRSTITSSTPASASAGSASATSSVRPADSMIRRTVRRLSGRRPASRAAAMMTARSTRQRRRVERAGRLLWEPAVGDRAGATERPRRVAAEQDRDLVGRGREAEDLRRQRVVRGVARSGCSGPAVARDLDPFGQACAPPRERGIERLEFPLEPAGAEPEFEPAPAGNVDRGALLGKHHRVPHWQHQDGSPEPHTLGRGRCERERDQRLDVGHVAGPGRAAVGGERVGRVHRPREDDVV